MLNLIPLNKIRKTILSDLLFAKKVFKVEFLKINSERVTGIYTGEKGTYHILNGKYHREDGPAIINSFKDKYWYHHGVCHRDDGPAIIFSDGFKRWYLNGVLFK